MTRARWLAAAGLLAGAALSALLWRHWTPRCTESCPAWLSLSMLGFCAALPLLGAAVGAAWAAPQRRLRRLAVALAVAAAVVAAGLSLAA